MGGARRGGQACGLAGAVIGHAPGAADTPGHVGRIRIGSVIGQATSRVAKAAGFAGPARAPVAFLIGSSSHGLAPSCRSPPGHSPLISLTPRELRALLPPPLPG